MPWEVNCRTGSLEMTAFAISAFSTIERQLSLPVGRIKPYKSYRPKLLNGGTMTLDASAIRHMIELYDHGCSIRTITRQFKLSRNTVKCRVASKSEPFLPWFASKTDPPLIHQTTPCTSKRREDSGVIEMALLTPHSKVALQTRQKHSSHCQTDRPFKKYNSQILGSWNAWTKIRAKRCRHKAQWLRTDVGDLASQRTEKTSQRSQTNQAIAPSPCWTWVYWVLWSSSGFCTSLANANAIAGPSAWCAASALAVITNGQNA